MHIHDNSSVASPQVIVAFGWIQFLRGYSSWLAKLQNSKLWIFFEADKSHISG
jgi:hypothetical protein